MVISGLLTLLTLVAICRTLLILVGWAAFSVLAYRVATSEAVQNVLYNPFELLGIDEVSIDHSQ